MKKLLLLALLVLPALFANAEMNGNGYYRVQNAYTTRYAYLIDNTGSFNAHTTSADVNALALYLDFQKASCDPSTIYYINKIDGAKYDYNVAGQGTSIYGFLGVYLKLLASKQYGGKQAYLAYATKDGFTKYLGDIRSDPDYDLGYPSVDSEGDRRLWWIDQINANSDDAWFGIKPTLNNGSTYYATIFCDFPFNAYSADVKFYIISKVDAENGIAVIKQLNGVVPANTPVIVECAGALPTNNRLNIGPDGSNADASGNQLGGVYFDNPMKTHYNRTPYNADTMRLLSFNGSGDMEFVTSSDLAFLPRNEAYLKVPANAPATLRVMNETEYKAYLDELANQGGNQGGDDPGNNDDPNKGDDPGNNDDPNKGDDPGNNDDPNQGQDNVNILQAVADGATFYDLAGVKVIHPVHGSTYIMVLNGKATKIVY